MIRGIVESEKSLTVWKCVFEDLDHKTSVVEHFFTSPIVVFPILQVLDCTTDRFFLFILWPC